MAPRIVPRRRRSPHHALTRYEAVRSSLDRGSAPGLVRPMSRIPYVPSAALVVRRDVVADCALRPRLRGGEDVDLVWRLVEAGWDVRYEPAATVAHDGPDDRRLLAGPPRLLRHHRRPAGPAPSPVARPPPHLGLDGRRLGPGRGPQAAPGCRGPGRLRCWSWPGGSTGLVDQPLTVAGRIAGGGTAKSALPALSGLTRAWSPALLLGLCWRRTRRAAALALLAPAVGDWIAARRRARPGPLRRAARGRRPRLRQRGLARLPQGAHPGPAPAPHRAPGARLVHPLAAGATGPGAARYRQEVRPPGAGTLSAMAAVVLQGPANTAPARST